MGRLVVTEFGVSGTSTIAIALPPSPLKRVVLRLPELRRSPLAPETCPSCNTAS